MDADFSPSESEGRGRQGGDRQASRSLLAVALLCLAALASVFLAGGPRQGGMGIFLGVAGGVLLLIRPARAVGWGGWLLALLVLVCVGFSMIPSDWLTEPLWRIKLQGLSALALPPYVTLDPRATVFWMLALSASLLLVLYVLASPLSSRGLELVALLAVMGCSVYAVVAWVAWQTGWHYPFFHREEWMQPAYGFFPNRNQTAGFLVSGAVLSLGLIYRGMKGGRLLPAFLAACSLALLVSMLLLFSQSRGGVLFLIVGVLLWVAGLGRHRSRWLVVGALGSFLAILLLFLHSESELLVRLRGAAPAAVAVVGAEKAEVAHTGDSNPFADARVSIWRDTLSMIADFPVTGTGLGTYHFVYPFYAKRSLRDRTVALHAESDWLTLCAEGGIPALLVVLGGMVLFLRRLPGLAASSGKEWPVRWAFLCAFFAEVLHGLVDVPFHKPELGWWLMLLGAVGCATGAGEVEVRVIARRVQRIFFLLAGLCLMALGGWMIWAQWGGGESLPPYSFDAEQKKMTELFGNGDKPCLKLAIEEGRKAIVSTPMSEPLYYQLGVLLLYLGEDPARSEALFAVERALAPHDANLVFEQGKMLAPVDLEAAVALWKEALRRQLLLDRLPDAPVGRSEGLFGQMLATVKTAESPDLLARMPGLAALDPKLQILWLAHPSCDPAMIEAAVTDAAFMEKLSPKEQGRLIQRWWERESEEGRGRVAAFLASHPEYNRSAVATRAAVLAASGDDESACRLLTESFSLPALVQNSGEQSIIRPPEGEVPSDPLAAARYYFELGNLVAARRLVAEAMRNGGDNQGDVFLLRSRMESHSGNWKEAYSSLLGFLHATSRL